MQNPVQFGYLNSLYDRHTSVHVNSLPSAACSQHLVQKLHSATEGTAGLGSDVHSVSKYDSNAIVSPAITYHEMNETKNAFLIISLSQCSRSMNVSSASGRAIGPAFAYVIS